MNVCRGCGYTDMKEVLDLGRVPEQKHFPELTASPEEPRHRLAMNLCVNCGLAQLAGDHIVTEEAGVLEPQAVIDQAEQAIKVLADAGWLDGATVREFDSPHGGSWLPLLHAYGLADADTDVADVVVDCFGVMHEPDQRAAFALRATSTAAHGVLLIQFHSLATIVDKQQWNVLRHGHFAYHSLTALSRLLAQVGMSVVSTWEFDLYGGTVLAAAVHGDVLPDEPTAQLLRREAGMGITRPEVVGSLQRSADDHARRLRGWLASEVRAGRRVYGYGAASKAVPLLSYAGIDRGLLAAVADASPTKQGRRIPGTDVPIVSPQELVDADPDSVLVLLPDLYAEVGRLYPELESRLTVGPQVIQRNC